MASASEPAARKGAPEMTASDVGAFLDGALPPQLAHEDIAGAVVAVVRNGQLLFAKGYGFADVARKTPVSAEETLFRPGSVSKLFTWTAVMQLAEQGKLDLDRDVNAYIDFEIPKKFGTPITMRNLLTHTPGFEEVLKELLINDTAKLKPLGIYLKEHVPQRIFPPGVTPAYSNYGGSLAGYIVERVSGEPFADYIDRHILEPLGMTRSTFRQPLPGPLVPLMSKGYLSSSQPPRPFEVIQMAPAGSMSLTAVDISRFMIAHLQDGRYGNVRILKPETARMMHSRQFGLIPEMNGITLGFYEDSRNGMRIIGHGGDTRVFHSDLRLIPEEGVGFFVSLNSLGKASVDVRASVWRAFLDRYFPFAPPAAQSPQTAARDTTSVTGRYISSRRSVNTLFKVSTLFSEIAVSRNADGTISASRLRGPGGRPLRFQEIGPMLFREVDGQARIGFLRDVGRRLTAVSDSPVFVLEKARWYEDSALNIPLLVGTIAVMALASLLWPVGALLRKHYGRKLDFDPKRRVLWLLGHLVPAVDLLFVLALNVGALRAPWADPWLRAFQVIGWLGVVGTLVPLYNVVGSWMKNGRWIFAKLGDTLLALACLGFMWLVFTWNLLAGSLKY
jgi:CubicO group peptidase (beta-lactamase class C family)